MLERIVQFTGERAAGHTGGLRLCPNHDLGPGWQPLESVAQQVPQPPSYRISHDRTADAAANHEAHASRRIRTVGARNQVDHHKRAADPHTTPYSAAVITGATPAILGRQHAHSSHRERHRPAGSGRQPGTALATSGADDGPTGPGAHTQPEAVGPRATAIVRLEGALHVRAPSSTRVGR